MKTHNKIRGKYFEDKISELYHSKFGIDVFACHRAGSSGARTSIEVTGDITFTDPRKYPIITECKYRLDLSLEKLFPNMSSEYCEWIEQCNQQKKLYISKIHGIEPLNFIVCGRPYLKDYYVILVNNFLDISDIQFMKSYNNKDDKYYEICMFSKYLNKIYDFLAKNNNPQ